MLQELEPYGIFAPDLKHSLLKQPEMQGLNNAQSSQVVKEHLQDVADGKISVISRALKLSTAEVRKCIDQIAKLNPETPGRVWRKNTTIMWFRILFSGKMTENGKLNSMSGWVEDYHINDYYLENDEGIHRRSAWGLFSEKTGAHPFCDEQVLHRDAGQFFKISEQILECTGAFFWMEPDS